jgi:glycosyltransferase involved in cell wall biosynthesis
MGKVVKSSIVLNQLRHIAPHAVFMGGYWTPELLCVLRWCSTAGIPAILLSESKADDCSRTWWREQLKAGLIGHFDGALVGGKPHRDYLVTLGMPERRIFLGCDVVDNEFYWMHAQKARRDAQRLARELCLPRRFFLTVLRLAPKKNLFRLIDAHRLYAVLAGTEAWPLVIVGGGPLERELKSYAREKAASHMDWRGYVRWNRLPLFYGLASAFILPSTTEQWGLVVNEAMASGLPVLVSRVAGCRYELVEDGANGFLFDPCDVAEMAQRMAQIAQLSEEQRAAMGRASHRIVSRWGPDHFARAIFCALDVADKKRTLRPMARALLAAATTPLGRTMSQWLT